jgi:hypothetical protein
MAAASEGTALVGDSEIRATRVFDAPRKLVWKVWTDPDHVGKWWGPNGFTTTTYGMEVKPGGIWRYVMHGPDGRDYRNKVTFLEVLPRAPGIQTRQRQGRPRPRARQFPLPCAEEGGKTRLACARCSRPPRARCAWSNTAGQGMPDPGASSTWRRWRRERRRRSSSASRSSIAISGPPPTKPSTASKTSFKLSISPGLVRRTDRARFSSGRRRPEASAPNTGEQHAIHSDGQGH